jgi:large subunit ribosomal protein L35
MNDHLKVFFNGQSIISGQTVKLLDVQKKPTVRYEPVTGKFYTLIMYDPDAPSKKNPFNKNWLHWLVINNDQTIVPFSPSNPPAGSGPHRYCLCLFEQRNNLRVSPINRREKFDVEKFVNHNQLHQISCLFYISENIISENVISENVIS